MRLRRTPQELRTFRTVRQDYIKEGLPEWKAEEYAWDFFHLERRIRNSK